MKKNILLFTIIIMLHTKYNKISARETIEKTYETKSTQYIPQQAQKIITAQEILQYEAREQKNTINHFSTPRKPFINHFLPDPKSYIKQKQESPILSQSKLTPGDILKLFATPKLKTVAKKLGDSLTSQTKQEPKQVKSPLRPPYHK